MTLTQLFLSQLTDPFRIGLLVVLFATMLRTRAATGTVIPLAAGAVFVAGLIPMTTARVAMGPNLATTIGTGIAANMVLLGVVWLAYTLWQRRR